MESLHTAVLHTAIEMNYMITQWHFYKFCIGRERTFQGSFWVWAWPNQRHYIVTPPLIGWAHTQNDHCLCKTVPYSGCSLCGLGGHFKNVCELLNLRALKFSPSNKIHIFQYMGKIVCVEFHREPLKFHTNYLTHTLKDMIFIQI